MNFGHDLREYKVKIKNRSGGSYRLKVVSMSDVDAVCDVLRALSIDADEVFEWSTVVVGSEHDQ
jgi:hypothetical protein